MILENPLVSILLNCYNSANFIEKAIKSVLNQSYQNWKLIIWDDGSTDNTLSLLEGYKDKRIKLFKNLNNLGLGKSRIKAIQEINGSLVSILDSDDYFEKDKILEQVKIFQKYPNISICTTWTKVFDDNFKLIYDFTFKKAEDVKKKLLFLNILPHSSLMYSKKLAMDVGWYSKELEYSQDYDLSLKLINKGNLFIVNKFLTNIIYHRSNMSNSRILKKNSTKRNKFNFI